MLALLKGGSTADPSVPHPSGMRLNYGESSGSEKLEKHDFTHAVWESELILTILSILPWEWPPGRPSKNQKSTTSVSSSSVLSEPHLGFSRSSLSGSDTDRTSSGLFRVTLRAVQVTVIPTLVDQEPQGRLTGHNRSHLDSQHSSCWCRRIIGLRPAI